MHQESQQITELLGFFDQQIFTRGLLQRNNFPLHFLSWTKTPLKWMAFAHSLWPQLAALLAGLVLWPAEQTGSRWRATEGVATTGTQNTSEPLYRPNKGLVGLFNFVLMFLEDFFFLFETLKQRGCLILLWKALQGLLQQYLQEEGKKISYLNALNR